MKIPPCWCQINVKGKDHTYIPILFHPTFKKLFLFIRPKVWGWPHRILWWEASYLFFVGGKIIETKKVVTVLKRGYKHWSAGSYQFQESYGELCVWECNKDLILPLMVLYTLHWMPQFFQNLKVMYYSWKYFCYHTAKLFVESGHVFMKLRYFLISWQHSSPMALLFWLIRLEVWQKLFPEAWQLIWVALYLWT